MIMQNSNSENGLPKFLADGMLFGLVKWLILLGYDVEKRNPKESIAEIEQKYPDRIFLTMRLRDDEEKPSKIFNIKSKDTWEQLKEVVGTFPIDFKGSFLSRCSECNLPLDVVEIEDVKEQLPKLVAQWIQECRRCPGCKKLYWKGTHYDRMCAAIVEKLGIDIQSH